MRHKVNIGFRTVSGVRALFRLEAGEQDQDDRVKEVSGEEKVVWKIFNVSALDEAFGAG